MKAIVAEIDKRHMIAITEKGDFVKVKRKISAGIGDEIELKPQNANTVYRRLAAMAACLLVAVFMTTGVYAYYTPYSYVSMDINPSVALTLNRFERVIEVDPLNEDAVKLIEDTRGLKNRNLNAAVAEIIKSASENGYINAKSSNQLVLVVSAKDPKQEGELFNEISAVAAGELSKVSKDYDLIVEKTSVPNYKAAVSNNISPGKLILANKLKEVMPELKDEEIRSMTVKEVAKLIKEGRKALKAEEKNQDEDKGKDNGKSDGKSATENKNGKGNSGNVKINGAAANGKEAGGNGSKGGNAAITGNKEDDDNADKGKNEDKKEEKYKIDKGHDQGIKGNPNGQNNGSNGRENNQDGDNGNGDGDDDEKGDTGKDDGNNKNGNGRDMNSGKNAGQ